jgi:hypothetical protein
VTPIVNVAAAGDVTAGVVEGDGVVVVTGDVVVVGAAGC